MVARAEIGANAARVDALRAGIAHKSILVTGGAGSIGAAVALRLAAIGCRKLTVLDQSDHGLIEVCESLHRAYPAQPVVDALCDVRDEARLRRWIGRVEPDIVIHAAALKHVHLGERHAGECVLTNLIGMRNALTASAAAGVSDFVFVSSDKAASPVCVMGATKRLGELYLSGFAREHGAGIRLKSVRFGNVWGSQGSVVPRFEAQIASGGPVEVTHPEMRRFFMSMEQAVSLILDVAAHVGSGRAPAASYFMEMGEPVSILDLARQMIQASGVDTDIAFVGLRPGEKLFEALYDEHECVEGSPFDGVFELRPCEARAHVSAADVAQLEQAARHSDDVVVRQRVFALLDSRLGRADQGVG